MSSSVSRQSFRCARCGREYSAPVYSFIDAEGNDALVESVMDGSLFVRECPSCGQRELISTPVVYKDSNCFICLSDRDLAIEGGIGDHARLVSDVGSLIEKVKIFHSGLDDMAMELCKYVTLQEMGKDVPMKFLRTEGADNELIFTYPENGQMQMVAVGFNVYEDCRGIVSRSPEMGSSARGIARIDSDWVARFIR